MTTEGMLANSLGVKVEIKQMPIGKYTINYLTAGSGPPLLLIHGANFGWGIWYPNISVLAQHFRIYAIDLPGAGRSTRVKYNHLDLRKDFLDVVDEFIRRISVDRLHIIGCSIGGWIALQMARRHPAIVDKIVLMNTFGFTDYIRWMEGSIGFYPLAWVIANSALKAKRQNKNVETFLRGIFFDKHLDLKPEFIEYFYETMASSHNLLFISRCVKLRQELLFRDQLPQIPNRVLIVWGKEDKIMRLEKNMPYFSLFPNVAIRLVESAGHIPSVERPEIFHTAVISFLK